MNDNKNSFDENFNNENYKKTARKLHDDGWKNGYFTSADVSKLSNGCVVSQFPQLYDHQ